MNGSDTPGTDVAAGSAALSTTARRARTRGRYPYFKRAGDFVFVSGTSSRRPDNTFAGASADDMGTTSLDIREQTRAVLQNIASILADAGGGLADAVQVTSYLV